MKFTLQRGGLSWGGLSALKFAWEAGNAVTWGYISLGAETEECHPPAHLQFCWWSHARDK